MKVIEIGLELRAEFGPAIQALESSAEYPLGEDRFRIDHGRDYFRFFDRLGKVHYWAAVQGSDVVAVGASVLRTLPTLDGGEMRAWYLCDLKVRPDHRGKGLPQKLLMHGFWRCYLRCPHAYAISMNPSHQPNPVVRMLQRFRLAPLSVACQLNIYSVNPAQWRECRELLERHRAALSLVSLHGMKDLVLRSTGRPLELYHAQFGEDGAKREFFNNMTGKATIMFCAPEGDPLVGELAALGVAPQATAAVLAHRMSDVDWRFILTSEI